MDKFNAPKWIAEKIRVRRYDENKKEDGSYNFIHRVDALTLAHLIENDFKSKITELEKQLAERVPFDVVRIACVHEEDAKCIWDEKTIGKCTTAENCPLIPED